MSILLSPALTNYQFCRAPKGPGSDPGKNLWTVEGCTSPSHPSVGERGSPLSLSITGGVRLVGDTDLSRDHPPQTRDEATKRSGPHSRWSPLDGHERRPDSSTRADPRVTRRRTSLEVPTSGKIFGHRKDGHHHDPPLPVSPGQG